MSSCFLKPESAKLFCKGVENDVDDGLHLIGLRWREQECNQVRHLLDGDGAFQTFWHQRKAGAGKLRDVATQDRIATGLATIGSAARRSVRKPSSTRKVFAASRAGVGWMSGSLPVTALGGGTIRRVRISGKQAHDKATD
jgi:hypothetical protein